MFEAVYGFKVKSEREEVFVIGVRLLLLRVLSVGFVHGKVVYSATERGRFTLYVISDL